MRRLDVLDSGAEPMFDALTRAAALATGAPISLISLVDADRQWFKSNLGMPGRTETPRNIAFCAHTILGPGLLQVADARTDSRFASNPLVVGDPGIRFYAGAPISLADGLRVGSLCVIDRQPRVLDASQQDLLASLARVAGLALEQRLLARQRTKALERQVAAEHLLAIDQERLASIIEATRAATWEWNVESGEMRLNSRWTELIGLTLEDLPPFTFEHWRRHTDPEDWERLSAQINAHLAGQLAYLDCELRMRDRRGQAVWVRCHGRTIKRLAEQTSTVVCGTLVDISERKEAEQRLRASEALLDRTGHLARVGGWEFDIATREFTFSDQTCRIHEVALGYRPSMEEALAFYPPQAREVVQVAVRKSLADGGRWDLEVPFITAKGTPLWVRVMGAIEYVDGRPRWLIGALQEVTVRRRAIQALEVSERRFRKLFQHSLGLICTHDLDGHILSANPAAANSLGYTLADLTGKRFTELMPVERHADFEAYLQRILLNKSDSGAIQLTARDGSQLVWQYHNVYEDEDAEPYVLGHAQDITQRMRYEHRLRDLTLRDPLTGCFNRRVLDEVELELGAGGMCGCIAIDLDRFKQVNDTHGHQRGDQVLVAMGQFLRENVRGGDMVIRAGGDEFLVLLKHADELLTKKIAAGIDQARNGAPIGFSMGQAVRMPGMTLDATLAEADRQLYRTRAAARS